MGPQVAAGGHQGVGMHQLQGYTRGGLREGGGDRGRESSSRQAKNKKPEEAPEEGGPSAFGSMD